MKTYVIGTVHNMIPKYKEELKSIFENINPDQMLVEIVQKDLFGNNFKKYPKEMVYAYRWGIKNKKIVNGFDVPITIIKKGISKKRLKELEKEAFRILSRHNWKEWNKTKYDKNKEFDKLMKRVLDFKKHRIRQNKMLTNIQKMMIKDGKILILTGAAHLRFFKRNLKKAIFPFRK